MINVLLIAAYMYREGTFTDEDFIDAWNLNEQDAEKMTKVLNDFLHEISG